MENCIRGLLPPTQAVLFLRRCYASRGQPFTRSLRVFSSRHRQSHRMCLSGLDRALCLYCSYCADSHIPQLSPRTKHLTGFCRHLTERHELFTKSRCPFENPDTSTFVRHRIKDHPPLSTAIPFSSSLFSVIPANTPAAHPIYPLSTLSEPFRMIRN